MKKHRRWTAEGDYIGALPKNGTFLSTTPGMVFSFAHQRDQYPKHGQPGISYFRGDFPDGTYVDVLLHRDEEGLVDGILFHYPFDMPPYQRRGSVNVYVDPLRQRQGIGTALLKAGGPRFKIDLTRQDYTPLGLKLANKAIRAPVAKAGSSSK